MLNGNLGKVAHVTLQEIEAKSSNFICNFAAQAVLSNINVPIFIFVHPILICISADFSPSSIFENSVVMFLPEGPDKERFKAFQSASVIFIKFLSILYLSIHVAIQFSNFDVKSWISENHAVISLLHRFSSHALTFKSFRVSYSSSRYHSSTLAL
jgi:hypothetical protein